MDPDDHPILARRLSRRRRIALDSLLVFAYLAALLLTGSTGAAAATPSLEVPWEQLTLVVAAIVPLVVRRIWPLPVFAVVLAVSVLAVARDVLWDPFLPASFAIYIVAVRLPLHRWWQRWLPGLTIASLALADLAARAIADEAFGRRGSPGLLPLGFAALLGAWQLGRSAHQKRAVAIRVAEHIAQRAATEERLRIARELHDVVTHSMGLIAVKAGVANHVLPTNPQEAYDALRVIEHTSRTALNDMRRMLGVLRTSEGGHQSAALGPVPGAVALPELVGAAGAQLTMRGVERLPDGVGLAVYRIVQEALTNVAKHAGAAARCQVVIDADGHRVRLDITDDGGNGTILATAPGGHGIVGMRERVALYGGTFTAGPHPQGGFAIRVSLPYKENA